jgi:hypothetical protein
MAIKCPRCRESNTRRSHRRMYDLLLRAVGRVPLRCNLCEHRFYCSRRTLLLAGMDAEHVIQ